MEKLAAMVAFLLAMIGAIGPGTISKPVKEGEALTLWIIDVQVKGVTEKGAVELFCLASLESPEFENGVLTLVFPARDACIAMTLNVSENRVEEFFLEDKIIINTGWFLERRPIQTIRWGEVRYLVMMQ